MSKLFTKLATALLVPLMAASTVTSVAAQTVEPSAEVPEGSALGVHRPRAAAVTRSDNK